MTRNRREDRKIREAVGVFVEEGGVRAALEELRSGGFESDEIGLLAGEHTVRQALGRFYDETNESAHGPDAPNMAFVARESVGDTVHAYLGSLFYAGTTVAAGTAVASAAVLGGGLLAAITGAAALGAIGAALGLVIHESDAEELEEQVEAGHLLVFVRTRDESREKRAVEILRKHTPIEVKVVSAPTEVS